MNYATDEDKELSTSNKPGNKCYGCGLPIFFTSKKEETPSGKPTKDPLTGKVIPLDLSLNEQHVCKPEDIEAFKQTDERKKRTEEWLSTQKSGQEVIASCLVRIPGSFNAKCLEAGRGLEESKVNIVQKWNGIAPKMPLEMLTDFKGYLVSLKIQKLEEERKQQQHYPSSSRHYANHRYKTTVPWIEKLLQTPLRDLRKSTIREVIAPYLITTRGLDYNHSFEIIKDWLQNKCDKVERLNPRDFNHIIKEALNRSINQSWRPISLDKLKKENLELYAMIMK